MKYTVGQVVYVVLNKKGQVYPMRIIEVISKKTLEGEATQYLLQAGSDSSTSIMMDKLDGEVFLSAEEVQQALIERASSQIKRLVAAAVQKSKEWYLEPQPVAQEIINHGNTINVDQADDSIKVMLPDGTVANIKMPAA